MARRTPHRTVGYAVVGLGHIAQTAVLPAFANARNSRLVALVSSDERKRKRLARAYGVAHTFSYDDFDACLGLEELDAVYIALPNHLHARFTVRAARAGVHVLCEKPMATNERECRQMIRAARDAEVRLMVAYRLHFEEANMRAVRTVEEGRVGEPRLFSSVFSYQVSPNNIRLRRAAGGGCVWDIGIYCVNAARYLFRDEPREVQAFFAEGRDERFSETEAGAGVVMRFSEDRLATFACSFDADAEATWQLLGTRGSLRLQNAYNYTGERLLETTVGGRTRERRFPEVDQFGPELRYFSDCVLEDREPEPSGDEGLADVRIITALYRSASIHRPVALEPVERRQRPGFGQAMRRPPVRERRTVHVEAPTEH